MSGRNMSIDVLVRLKDRLTGPLGRLKAAISRFTDAMRKIGAAVGGLALGSLAALTATMGFLGKGVIGTGMEFERFRAILKTLSGSSIQADKDLAWVQKFAETTPYGLADVTQAFVRLKGVGLDPMNGLLLNTGNMAAAMGTDIGQAVEAIADAVAGENERLKEFNILASREGDKTVYSFTHQGKQMTKTVRNTVADITRGLNEIMALKYDGAMGELSKTLSGILGNLSDMWSKFEKMIADAGFFDYIKERMQGVYDAVTAMEADGTLQKIATVISDNLVGALKVAERYGKRAFEWARRFDWRELLDDMLAIGRGIRSALSAIGGAIGAVRGFFRDLGSIGDGGFAEMAGGVGNAIRRLAGSLDGGSLTALAIGGGVLLTFGLKLARIGGGLPLKLAAIALGLSSLTKMGGEMTAVDWAFAAAGLGTLATSLFKVGRAMKGIASAGGAVDAIRGAAGAAGGNGRGGGIGAGRGMATGFAALGLWDMILGHGSRVEAAKAANGGDAGAALAQVINENRQAQREFFAPLQAQLDRLYGIFHGPKGETTAGGKEGRLGTGFFADIREAVTGGLQAGMKGFEALKKAMAPAIPIPTPRPEIVEPLRVEGEAAAQLADALGARITDAFSVNAMPTVDTSSIDSARGKVDALAAALRRIPGTTAGAGAAVPIDGARAAGGPVQRGRLYLVGERGPELVRAGSNGTVHDAGTSRRMMEGGPAGFVPRGGGNEVVAMLGRIERHLASQRVSGDITVKVEGPGRVTGSKVGVGPDRGRAVGLA